MPVRTTKEQIVFEGIDRLSGPSKQAQSAVAVLRSSLDAVKGALGAVGVTVGAGAMVNLYMNALKATAALDDMSAATGASVEGLSALERVAKVGGHDFEGLTGQIGKMIKGLKDGGEEGNKTAHALGFLGIQARNTDGTFRDTSAVLVDVARKLGQYKDGGDKVAIVQDILGKGAERYIPLLKDVAEGTDHFATVTAKQAEEADRLEKNISRLKVAMEDARREVVVGLNPAMLSFTDRLIAAQKEGGLLLMTLRLMAAGASVAGPLAPLGMVAGKAIDAARPRPPSASQSQVRAVDNALEEKPLTYEQQDIPAAAREAMFRAQKALELEDMGLTDAREAWGFYTKGLEEAAKKQLEFGLVLESGEQLRRRLYEERTKQVDEGLKLDKERDALEFERISLNTLTEEEAEIARYQRQRELMERMAMDQHEHDQRTETMYAQHQAKLAQIRQRGMSELERIQSASLGVQFNAVVTSGVALMAAAGAINEKWAKAARIVGAGQALVSTYVGAAEALRLPYPANLIAAAKVLAAGFGFVAAIKSGGGGSGSSSASIGPTGQLEVPTSAPLLPPPTAPQEASAPAAQQQQRRIEVHFHGDGQLRLTRRELEDLFDDINELLGDGGALNIRAESILVGGSRGILA